MLPHSCSVRQFLIFGFLRDKSSTACSGRISTFAQLRVTNAALQESLLLASLYTRHGSKEDASEPCQDRAGHRRRTDIHLEAASRSNTNPVGPFCFIPRKLDAARLTLVSEALCL